MFSTVKKPESVASCPWLIPFSHLFGNSCILYRRFKHLGLTNVQATPLIHEVSNLALVESAFDLDTMTQRAVAAGVIAQQRATSWLTSLADARDAGWFFCAIGGFLAFGRKPS